MIMIDTSKYEKAREELIRDVDKYLEENPLYERVDVFVRNFDDSTLKDHRFKHFNIVDWEDDYFLLYSKEWFPDERFHTGIVDKIGLAEYIEKDSLHN